MKALVIFSIMFLGINSFANEICSNIDSNLSFEKEQGSRVSLLKVYKDGEFFGKVGVIILGSSDSSSGDESIEIQSGAIQTKSSTEQITFISKSTTQKLKVDGKKQKITSTENSIVFRNQTYICTEMP